MSQAIEQTGNNNPEVPLTTEDGGEVKDDLEEEDPFTKRRY